MSKTAGGVPDGRATSGVEFAFGGARWRALPERAAVWIDRRWLVVADLHLGKAATFRARGVPVPAGTTGGTLQRLSELIECERPRRLVILGDLLHAREAQAPETIAQLAAWRARHVALPMLLVEGNHDRHAGTPPPELDIEPVSEPWRDGGLALRHDPEPDATAAVLAGHLHPCVRLQGAGGDRLRLPCFWQRAGLLVLPAFGEFTGGATIRREPGDRVLAIGGERVFEIPPVAAPPRRR